MSPRVKGAVVLVLAFLLGAVTGGVALSLYQMHAGWWWHARADGARFQQYLLRRLTRELDLRPDQRDRVEAILRDSGVEFAQLREEIRPRFREIRTRTRERIRAVLDANQQQKFERLTAEGAGSTGWWGVQRPREGEGPAKRP
jgi:Spy/CpxP family protein refolding chaperone